MSPEIIYPRRFGFKNSCPTISSDCYTLGMVIYETISGHIPFHEDTDSMALAKVTRGEPPPREDLFSDNLWKMLKTSWAWNPKKRPSIGGVLRCLERLSDAPSATNSGRLAFFSPKSRLRPSPSKLGSPMNPPLVSFEVTWNWTVETDKMNSLPDTRATRSSCIPCQVIETPEVAVTLLTAKTADPSRGNTTGESPLGTEGSTNVPNIGTQYWMSPTPAASPSQAMRDPEHDVEKYIDELDNVDSLLSPFFKAKNYYSV